VSFACALFSQSNGLNSPSGLYNLQPVSLTPFFPFSIFFFDRHLCAFFSISFHLSFAFPSFLFFFLEAISVFLVMLDIFFLSLNFPLRGCPVRFLCVVVPGAWVSAGWITALPALRSVLLYQRFSVFAQSAFLMSFSPIDTADLSLALAGFLFLT